LRVDAADRKIGLSRKNLDAPVPEEEAAPAGEEKEKAPGKPRRELRGGTGSEGGKLFAMPGEKQAAAEEPNEES
jgi:hypothetical protein